MSTAGRSKTGAKCVAGQAFKSAGPENMQGVEMCQAAEKVRQFEQEAKKDGRWWLWWRFS